jgi:hypothetical protein
MGKGPMANAGVSANQLQLISTAGTKRADPGCVKQHHFTTKAALVAALQAGQLGPLCIEFVAGKTVGGVNQDVVSYGGDAAKMLKVKESNFGHRGVTIFTYQLPRPGGHGTIVAAGANTIDACLHCCWHVLESVVGLAELRTAGCRGHDPANRRSLVSLAASALGKRRHSSSG